MTTARIPRLPLLAGGALSLLAGLLAGEARMGWDVPAASMVHLHGPLMISGFFGTVIGLERAVALGKSWGYLTPLLTGLGGIMLLAGFEDMGAALMVFGSLIFLAMAIAVLRRQRETFTAIMALGALAWTAGNAAWFHGAEIAHVVPLWASFLVLTIAGERLELSRFLKPWRWRGPSLIPPVAIMALGAVLAAFAMDGAWIVYGIGLLLLVAWSLMNDVARRTIRQPGLTRYVAICLLSGYVWLALAGAAALFLHGPLAVEFNDIALHALFVGFVFSMVFGHGPIIVPAVMRVKVAWGLHFYVPLAVLHLSLGMRVLGTLMELDHVKQWGGLLNGLAILLFMATMVTAVLRARVRL